MEKSIGQTPEHKTILNIINNCKTATKSERTNSIFHTKKLITKNSQISRRLQLSIWPPTKATKLTGQFS